MLQVVTFNLKDLKSVLYTFLLLNVAFNGGAAHGLEECNWVWKRTGNVRTANLQLREEASWMHTNGTF